MDFPLELHRGHVIALGGDRRLLIDTGSPGSSAGRAISRAPDGSCSRAPFGDDIDSIAADVGARLDGIVGMDLVARLGGVTLRWVDKRLFFGPASSDGAVIAAGPRRRAPPRAVARIGDSGVSAVVDYGAFISYATPTLLDGLPTTGEVDDFHPQFGGLQSRCADSRLP